MAGVLCSGNLVLDILVRPFDSAAWGTTTLVDSIEQHLGGNGANTAYTLGRLNIPTRLVGMVGADPFGEFVLAKLLSAGVDTAAIRRSAAPTATTVALVNSRGDRLFLHRIGSSSETFFEPADLFQEIKTGTAHYHMASVFGLPRLRPHNPDILRRARKAGLTTSIDTHWDTLGRWMEDLAPCLPHTGILFVNEDEARMLTGSSVPSEAASRFRNLGAGHVVIKLSGNGCGIFTGEGETYVPAFDVPVVDTTGAGDCFVGAFLAALQRGCSYSDAARFANGVAALAIQQLGAVEGVLSYPETEKWILSARIK